MSDELLMLLRAREADLERANDTAARLREALRPFADYADPAPPWAPSDMLITNGSRMARRQLTMGDCLAARAALEADNG